MKRALPDSESTDAGREKRDGREEHDNRMGFAPVFAATLGAACCLGVPILVGLLGGGTAASLSGGDIDLLTLVIIGFALGGVLAVAVSYLRTRERPRDDLPGGREPGPSETGT